MASARAVLLAAVLMAAGALSAGNEGFLGDAGPRWPAGWLRARKPRAPRPRRHGPRQARKATAQCLASDCSGHERHQRAPPRAQRLPAPAALSSQARVNPPHPAVALCAAQGPAAPKPRAATAVPITIVWDNTAAEVPRQERETRKNMAAILCGNIPQEVGWCRCA